MRGIHAILISPASQVPLKRLADDDELLDYSPENRVSGTAYFF
ncbi:MAG: hypothetical protein QM687_12570 [Ferruginibacter sp.]